VKQRSSPASHFVLPKHYICSCLLKYFDSFESIQGFILDNSLYLASNAAVPEYFWQNAHYWIRNKYNLSNTFEIKIIIHPVNMASSLYTSYITESIRNGLLIEIQQWLTRSHKSVSQHFVLLCTEMAALMKGAYDGYRYIFNDCAGK